MFLRVLTVVLLGSVFASCATPEDTSRLDGAISEVRQNVATAENDVKKYNAGSALWALASLRVETHKQTLAMLEQKRASILYYTRLAYNVGGSTYQVPPDKEQRISQIQGEISRVTEESKAAFAKAEKLGGLVGALSSMEAMTKTLSLAQLEYQLLAYQHDFPPLFPRGEHPVTLTDQPKPQEDTVALAEPVAGKEEEQQTGPRDFRVAQWGATKKDVKAREKLPLGEENENSLAYTTNVAGVTVIAVYEFDNDQLVRGSYLNKENHMNKTDYIRDYQTLKDILRKKYGKPRTDDTIWKNDLYKDRPQDWGIAVSTGQLAYRAGWDTERSKIYMILTGDNFTVNHGVVYEEKASEATREKRREKQTLDQF